MIGTVYGEAGKPVCIQGIVGDYGKAICAVEFSLDDGTHWSRYEIDKCVSGLNVNFSFDYTPREPGCYHMLIRSVNDKGIVSPEPSFVNMVIV